MLFTSAGVVTVAEGVRLLRRSSASLMRAGRAISLSLALITLAWGVVMHILPEGIGRLVLGQDWAGAQSVIEPLTLAMAGLALAFGPITGLRSLGAAKRSLRARIADATLTTTIMLLGTIYQRSRRRSLGISGRRGYPRPYLVVAVLARA